MKILYRLAGVALAVWAFSLTTALAQGVGPYKITAIDLPEGYSITPGSFVVSGDYPPTLRLNNNSVIVGEARKPVSSGEPGVVYDTLSFRLSGGFLTDLGAVLVSAVNDRDHTVSLRELDCDFIISGDGVSVVPERLGTCTRPRSINDSDQVVGVASVGVGVQHAFLYAGGGVIDIGQLIVNINNSQTNSTATDVNNSGHVVGWSAVNSDEPRAFLYKDGVMSILSPENGRSVASGINDSGQVVGHSNFNNRFGGGLTAFIYEDGVMTNLGTLPGAVWGMARSINNRGRVVGVAFDEIFVPSRAFLYSGGVMHDLNDLIPPGSGWKLVDATDINDFGQIVGVGTKDGKEVGFILSPAAKDLPLPKRGGSPVLRKG